MWTDLILLLVGFACGGIVGYTTKVERESSPRLEAQIRHLTAELLRRRR